MHFHTFKYLLTLVPLALSVPSLSLCLTYTKSRENSRIQNFPPLSLLLSLTFSFTFTFAVLLNLHPGSPQLKLWLRESKPQVKEKVQMKVKVKVKVKALVTIMVLYISLLEVSWHIFGMILFATFTRRSKLETQNSKLGTDWKMVWGKSLSSFKFSRICFIPHFTSTFV